MKRQIKNFLHNITSLTSDPALLNSRITSSNINVDGLCHLGCGDVDIRGWVNIDARNSSHVHLVDLDLSLSTFQDSSISAIYMCHVLEHFPFDQVSRILSLLYSKLDRNGLLYLSVPDFSSICNIYLKTNSIETISSVVRWSGL